MNVNDAAQSQSVVIIDDHPLFRKGLAQLLRSVEGFKLIGEAPNGQEGISCVLKLQPDLLLLDLNMKGMSGVEVLRRIKQADLDTRIVMLTVSDGADDLVAALRAGADGYLLKDMEPEDILTALQDVAHGRIVVSESLTHLMAAALRQDPRPDNADAAGLTEQEIRILERIAEGLSNKMVARELDITEGTVKVHVKHILRKLNLRSRVEAAVWAVAHGHTR